MLHNYRRPKPVTEAGQLDDTQQKKRIPRALQSISGATEWTKSFVECEGKAMNESYIRYWSHPTTQESRKRIFDKNGQRLFLDRLSGQKILPPL